jgi:hypothetical protein
MKVLRIKKKSNFRIGIVKSKDWFPKNKSYYLRDQDYVVSSWFTFSDGIKNHIEGKTTIAVCRSFKDAELIFKTKKL